MANKKWNYVKSLAGCSIYNYSIRQYENSNRTKTKLELAFSGIRNMLSVNKVENTLILDKDSFVNRYNDVADSSDRHRWSDFKFLNELCIEFFDESLINEDNE
jgi:hypothetical protein